VERAWAEALEFGAVEMVEIQKKILGDLKEWDRNVLGELEKRISRVKKELKCYRRSRINQENVHKEHVLRFKLDIARTTPYLLETKSPSLMADKR